MNSNLDLKDKVAIVTGSARGIGKAYAYKLASQGTKVVVADILSEKGQEVAKQIVLDGGEATYVETDLKNDGSVEEMIHQTVNKYGGLDILVNNAAIVNVNSGPVDQMKIEDWDSVMSVNARGYFLCTKYAVPHMKKKGKGKIVNVASTTFLTGGTADLKSSSLPYVVSKGAVVGLTRALARELGRYKINVNTLMPGLVRTEVFENEMKERYKEMMEPTLHERCIQRDLVADDLAKVMLFLVSSESDAITGQIMVVDGGRCLY